jgi:hypothetical protein
MICNLALVYLSVNSGQIPFSESLRQVSTIKVFEIVTYINTKDPFENVVVFHHEVAQDVNWVILVTDPIWQAQMAGFSHKSGKGTISTFGVTSNLDKRLHIIV